MNDSRLEGTPNGAGNGHANGHAVPKQQGPSKFDSQAAALHQQWATDPRWAGIERTYSAKDVVKLRGSVQEEHTLARLGAERLWSLLQLRRLRERPRRAHR